MKNRKPRYRKTENTASLLGGALLGAAAMYLLDPQSGRRRREHLGEVAGSAAHDTAERLAPVWDKVSTGARSLAAGVAERAGDVASRASDLGSDVASHASEAPASVRGRLSNLGHELIDRARHLGRSASSHAEDVSDDASGWLSRRRRAAAEMIDPESHRSHATGYAAAGVGTLLVGAGLMYLLDPQRGRQRRALLSDKATRFVNETGTAFRRSGRYLAGRAQGVLHQGAGMMRGSQPVSAEQLLQRVRSQLGHAVSRPGEIQVMTDADGIVTLSGNVMASEMDVLLSTVNGVSGVNQVVNRCEVQSTPEPSGGGARSRGTVPRM